MTRGTLWASAAAFGAAFAAPAPALAQEPAYFGTNLFGTSVPGGGEEDATGDFNAEIDFAKGRICYYLEFDRLADADGAGIHRGEEGQSGPAVVPLPLPEAGNDEVCTGADAAVLAAIAREPKGYYVAVRTPSHPDGAIRGQLD